MQFEMFSNMEPNPEDRRLENDYMNTLKSLLEFLKSVSEFLHNPMAAEEVDSSYVHFAGDAYALLTDWFGVPLDASVPYEVVIDTISCLSFDSVRRRYAIFVRRQDQVEDMFASVAHEMYHRITTKRKRDGLHQHVWVDEVLAFYASQKVMIECGYIDFAKTRMQSVHNAPRRLSLHELSQIRRSSFTLRRRSYPMFFGTTVAIVAETLEHLVGWENMCLLTQHKSWDSWASVLSDDQRYQFNATFGLLESQPKAI